MNSLTNIASFLSEQPFPISHTNCKIKLQRLLLALVLKRDPKSHINHILEYTPYVPQLQLYFITWHFGNQGTLLQLSFILALTGKI